VRAKDVERGDEQRDRGDEQRAVPGREGQQDFRARHDERSEEQNQGDGRGV
jgi:hypothetical protein